MATLTEAFFEIERRVVLFKSTTTMPDSSQLGFDADPNTAVNGATPGQTLIYSCPTGTRYQETSGKQWFKETSPNIWSEFGAGGGGGAATLAEAYRNLHELSTYEFRTENVIEIAKETLVDSATASYLAADNAYKFASIGQNVISKQMLCSDFIAAGEDIATVRAQVNFLEGAIDPAPVVSLSRDGGTNYQVVTMSRLGNTGTFDGELTFVDETVHSTLEEYAVTNADSVDSLNVTDSLYLAGSFTVSATEAMRKITMYLNKVGAVAGNFSLRIVRDVAGSPSTDLNDVLTESELIACSSLSVGDNAVVIDLYNLRAVGIYWIVLVPDAGYIYSVGVTELNWRSDASAPTGGVAKKWNGSTWATIAKSFTYKMEGRALDLRIKVVSSAINVELTGTCLLYRILSSIGEELVEAPYVYPFTGTNENVFVLPWFPNYDTVQCLHIETQKLFMAPAFTVDGPSIVFPVNTFNLGPGITVTLKFFNGGSLKTIDSSTSNASILAENRLGSLTPSLDRSVAGEGILLRASNGTLVEASIYWDGVGYQWQFSEVV